MAEGEFALVRQILEAAVDLPAEWIGDHDMYVMLADVAASQHDLAGIQKYAPQAEVLAERYQHLLYQAITHRAWGVAYRLTGDYIQSDARLKKALNLFIRLDARWQAGRTLFELGELARASNELVAAQSWFAEALSAFEEMNAQIEVKRTWVELEELRFCLEKDGLSASNLPP
jgi:tetratricopeptide (TPR) repeat protein